MEDFSVTSLSYYNHARVWRQNINTIFGIQFSFLKKFIGVSIVLSFIAANCFSQGLYLRVGAGYAFAHAGQYNDGGGQNYSGSVNLNTPSQAFSVKNASFGAGSFAHLGFGYAFNNHVAVQLDASIALSTPSYTFNIGNDSVNGILSNVSYLTKATRPFLLTPSLVLQSGGDVWNVYSRFGLSLPLNTKMTQDLVVSNAPGTGALTTYDITFQIKNKFALGLAAAAGLSYKVNDQITVWGEANLLSMSVLIRESDITELTVNGQKYALSAISGPLTVTYSKSGTIDSTGTSAPTYSQPFSNIGIAAGVSLRISERRSRNAGRRAEMIEGRKRF